MPENPLLPHRKLQELYTLMGRARVLERKHRQGLPSREAVLAATFIHLQPGDMVSAPESDRAAREMAPAARTAAAGARSFEPSLSRLMLAAASARGLRFAGNSGVLCAVAEAEIRDPGWTEALAWAQAERLPFVFLCTDSAAKPARRRVAAAADRLDWPALQSHAQRLQLPTLTVDGDDAVAVFRCLQEATLRARSGAGPSVVWAMLTGEAQEQPRTQGPRARLERYLKAREIEIPR